jgi:putative ABC transport system ATP-binding protein
MAENNLCIALNQVGKTVDTPDGELDILNNISLDVKYQEAVVIKGASGSGKTTLLGLMAGLDQSTSGDVFLLGHSSAHLSVPARLDSYSSLFIWFRVPARCKMSCYRLN